MAIWIKPNGMEIETNDQPGNLKAAVKLGWKLKEEQPGDEIDVPVVNGEADHIAAIKSMAKTELIGEYMANLGIQIDINGHLKTVRKNALAAIEAQFQGAQ